MTVNELIKRLEEYRDALGGDAVMRFDTLIELVGVEEFNRFLDDSDG
jgi:hypothetical protein